LQIKSDEPEQKWKAEVELVFGGARAPRQQESGRKTSEKQQKSSRKAAEKEQQKPLLRARAARGPIVLGAPAGRPIIAARRPRATFAAGLALLLGRSCSASGSG